MKVTFKSTDSLDHFVGSNDEGKTINISSDGNAPRPMQVLLMAAAGCSSMDVVHVMRKMKQNVTNLEVQVEGTRKDEIPKVFTKIHMHYILTGENIDEQKVQRAIELSLGKYCSVSKMLEKAAEITSSFEIVPSK